jgi:DNA-directed RNA polymerase subunit F
VSRHPIPDKVRSLLKSRAIELGRCVKACYTAESGELTLEGRSVLADLRKFAKLGSHKENAFLRDLTGALDPLAMARIEGRREVVNRLIDFLELDPSEARAIVEVDNGHN